MLSYYWNVVTIRYSYIQRINLSCIALHIEATTFFKCKGASDHRSSHSKLCELELVLGLRSSDRKMKNFWKMKNFGELRHSCDVNYTLCSIV